MLVAVAMTGGVDGRGVGRGVVVSSSFGAGLATLGASGVGASVCAGLTWVDEDVGADGLTGASAIRGAASLRGPVGGSSGVGPAAPSATPGSATATAVTHAATPIPLSRSVRRRDDVLVDTRPSLFR